MYFPKETIFENPVTCIQNISLGYSWGSLPVTIGFIPLIEEDKLDIFSQYNGVDHYNQMMLAIVHKKRHNVNSCEYELHGAIILSRKMFTTCSQNCQIQTKPGNFKLKFFTYII